MSREACTCGLTLLLLSTVGCREALSHPTRSPALERGRAILARYCEPCHRPSAPGARAGALAVFSLEDADWSARMSEAQLREAALRLRELGKVTREDARAFEEVVERLLKRRGSGSVRTPARGHDGGSGPFGVDAAAGEDGWDG